jgi:hypothetical protein
MGSHEHACAAPVPQVEQIANTRSLDKFLIEPPQVCRLT